MNSARKVLAASVLGFLLAGLVSGAATVLGLVTCVVGSLEDPEFVTAIADAWFQEAADSLAESGFDPGATDPNDPLLRDRILLITESINERVARRVIQSLFYLDRMDASAPITLYIATQGGWLDPAFAIVDAMRAIRAPVDTVAIGGCFSAGAVVLAAGTGTRSATPNAIVSIHANSAEGDDSLSYERLARERFDRHFEQNAELPREWFPLTGDRSYYLTPDDALKHGLIDRVETPKRVRPAA